eukprot:31229-Pelagococcus_subviridis.AAC.16
MSRSSRVETHCSTQNPVNRRRAFASRNASFLCANDPAPLVAFVVFAPALSPGDIDIELDRACASRPLPSSVGDDASGDVGRQSLPAAPSYDVHARCNGDHEAVFSLDPDPDPPPDPRRDADAYAACSRRFAAARLSAASRASTSNRDSSTTAPRVSSSSSSSPPPPPPPPPPPRLESNNLRIARRLSRSVAPADTSPLARTTAAGDGDGDESPRSRVALAAK